MTNRLKMQLFNEPALPDDLQPGAGLVMRSLDANDFDKGYVALLGQVDPLESLRAGFPAQYPLTSRASRRPCTADTGAGAGPRSVDGAISEDARQVIVPVSVSLYGRCGRGAGRSGPSPCVRRERHARTRCCSHAMLLCCSHAMLRNAAMLLARNDARDAAGSKCYYTVVVEDVAASKIVATATLLVEVLVVPVCMPCRVHVERCTPLSTLLMPVVRPCRFNARRVMKDMCWHLLAVQVLARWTSRRAHRRRRGRRVSAVCMLS